MGEKGLMICILLMLALKGAKIYRDTINSFIRLLNYTHFILNFKLLSFLKEWFILCFNTEQSTGIMKYCPKYHYFVIVGHEANQFRELNKIMWHKDINIINPFSKDGLKETFLIHFNYRLQE